MGKRSAFPAAVFRRAIVHARVSPTMSLRQPEPWRHTAQLTISAAVLAWNAQARRHVRSPATCHACTVRQSS